MWEGTDVYLRAYNVTFQSWFIPRSFWLNPILQCILSHRNSLLTGDDISSLDHTTLSIPRVGVLNSWPYELHGSGHLAAGAKTEGRGRQVLGTLECRKKPDLRPPGGTLGLRDDLGGQKPMSSPLLTVSSGEQCVGPLAEFSH